MSDPQHSPDHLPEEHPEVQEEPYVPASPVKRTLAWMGVVYMVIIVALTTYNFGHWFPAARCTRHHALPSLRRTVRAILSAL